MTTTAPIKNDPPRHYMLCDALADSIRERLFRHEFAPRFPLDKAALAAHYRTERQTLTAALERLARERLLTAQADGGYCAAEYERADIEDILALLECIRFFMLRRHASRADAASGAAGEAVSASPYWGPAGLLARRPFAVAARNLYEQLRLGIGPEFAAIEARCAQACADDLARAAAHGEYERIGDFCAKSAGQFRQLILAAFDDAETRQIVSPA
ncbi:MAG: GntR family transcriptional regulator [Azoarcus sp.]|nr:GntR family transcriptional regulator [Azoarcus sp.]